MSTTHKKYDYLVFVGRMQPVTIAHIKIIKMAMNMADNVIVLVGSSGEPRSIKNPFTYEERKQWLDDHFKNDKNVFIRPIYDFPYHDLKWLSHCQKTVDNIVTSDMTGGIIGYMKDGSSYYLTELFPQWATVDVKPHFHSNGELIHATTIREAFFNGTASYGPADGKVDVSDSIKLKVFEDIEYLLEHNTELQAVRDMFVSLPEYHAKWGKGPFVTGDAVVVQNGHILLITRKENPGKGLWALPGGFINLNERIRDGIIRELHEETQVKVPVEVLKRNIKHVHVFDAPDRDPRGRVITHAAFIDLGNFQKLPHVKGSDDAEKAQWVPFSSLRRDMFFCDHAHIADFFIGYL